MRMILRFSLFASAGLWIGCGDGPPSTSNPGTPPPHGGTLVELPDGGGYVEVVKKEGATRGAPASAEVAFYVLKDMTTPYSPAPTSGTLTVGKNKNIALKPEGGALITPPGPPLFKDRDPDGSLSIELGGKPVTIPLGIR